MIGAAAFPTEHSIARKIGMSRPNKEDLKVIADFGVQLNRRIKKSENFDNISIEVPGNGPYKKYSTTSLTPKVDTTLCTECKACAKACPAGAISMTDPKKTDKKLCISCMRCVRSCKQRARYVSTFKMNQLEKKLTKICKTDKAADIFM